MGSIACLACKFGSRECRGYIVVFSRVDGRGHRCRSRPIHSYLRRHRFEASHDRNMSISRLVDDFCLRVAIYFELTWTEPSGFTYSSILSSRSVAVPASFGDIVVNAREVVSKSSGKYPPGTSGQVSPKFY